MGTYRCEDCGGKVEGSAKLPLNACFVGHIFDDDGGEYTEVGG